MAFSHALRVGLTALETDAWLSKDGEVMLHHDGKIRSGIRLRRRPISEFLRADLPSYIPSLRDLCAIAEPTVDIQIDVKGLDTARSVVRVFNECRPDSLQHLWLADSGYRDSNWKLVSQWRNLGPQIHLIDSTSVARFDVPADEYLARAQSLGIEVLNLPAWQWHPHLIEIVHRHGLLAFAFNAQKPALISSLCSMGIDGIYSDHVDRLVQVLKLGQG